MGYRSSTEPIRNVALSILAADAGMSPEKAIETILRLTPSQLKSLKQEVRGGGGAAETVMAVEKEAAVPAALKAAILALAVLLPAVSAQDQGKFIDEITTAKQQVMEAKRKGDLLSGMTTIAGKKYMFRTVGEKDALAQMSKLDKQMAGKVKQQDRQTIIDDLAEDAGIVAAKS